MKKLLWGASILALVTVFPLIATAQVNVGIKVPLPPPIPFIAPPAVIVLPGTDVYAVPDVEEDIFFQQGWWWRHWDNRWYRSRYHDRGWDYYRGYPAWYRGIPHNWRDNYRNHEWRGQPWNHRPIHRDRLDRHWREGRWKTDHGWGPPDRRRGPDGHGGRDGGRGPDGPGGRDDRNRR